MALVDSVLAAALQGLYTEMAVAPMSDATFAQKMAKILDDQTKTAAIPAGEVIVAVGGGSGAPATGTSNPSPINVT